jgi:hypothetical protein
MTRKGEFVMPVGFIMGHASMAAFASATPLMITVRLQDTRDTVFVRRAGTPLLKDDRLWPGVSR